MSKILIVPDIHYCRSSSIIRSRGKKFSTRIENCIASINWCENLACLQECTSVFYLGDFFNSDSLDSEVLSSLSNIQFSDLPHFCISGNHEMSTTDNLFSSIRLLENFNNINVVSNPMTIENDDIYLHILPYIYDVEEDITRYFDFCDKRKKHVLLSHNDLKGIFYGNFISKQGLNVNTLDATCDLVINGHIHNESWVSEKILNLGILTGKNFNEDAFKYKHKVIILDTKTLCIKEFENPYAFNFYKLDINSQEDLHTLNNLKSNSIVSIKCINDLCNDVRNILNTNKNIAESRLIISQSKLDLNENLKHEDNKNLSVDHLEKLKEFCLSKIDNSDILLSELQEICT